MPKKQSTKKQTNYLTNLHNTIQQDATPYNTTQLYTTTCNDMQQNTGQHSKTQQRTTYIMS